jgi:hypothetical protein
MVSKSGIPHNLKGPVNDLIVGGVKPRFIQTILSDQGKYDEDLLKKLTIERIRNRKKVIDSSSKWILKSKNHWRNFIRSNMMNIDEFVSLPDNSEKIIVVESFVNERKKKNGGIIEDIGCSMSNKTLILNYVDLIDKYSGELDLCVDGTYKLVYGWILIVIGFRYLRRVSDGKQNFQGQEYYYQSFIPILFTLTPTESHVSYSCSLKVILNKYFPDRNLTVNSITIDHSQVIRNSITEIFGSTVTVLCCWVHIFRNLKEHKSKLKVKSNLKIIEDHVKSMHYCSTLNQFLSISSACLQHWRDIDELEFAQWFQNTY